jgi:ectoine hydroxylase
MNRVTPDTPLPEITALLQRDGYVLMENALTLAQVAELSAAYDQQLALHPPAPGASRVEVKRILEQGLPFEQLMDLPTVFPVARAMIGADIELASSGELDHKLPRTPAYISWHNDFQWMVNVPYPRQNFWIRCTYFLTEVTEPMGPFTLLPGSHRADHACPGDFTGPNGQPRVIEGQVPITGAAGSCLINNTEIWHTNTPNRSDLPRRLIMILYKHAWMKQWQEGYETTPEFAAHQTDPLRRQLTGNVVWHHGEAHFPAALQPSRG